MLCCCYVKSLRVLLSDIPGDDRKNILLRGCAFFHTRVDISRVLDVKLPDGSKKCIISETTRKALNNIVFFLGILLVAVWGYFYITHCLMVEKNTQLTNQ